MICHQTKCLFVHIPKTAGQSFEHVFLKNAGLDWETREPLLLRENKCDKVGPPRLAHLHAVDYVRYRYLSQELFDGYFKFAIVRDPWARTVSFYHYMGYANRMSFLSFVKQLSIEINGKKRWFVGPQSDYVYDTTGNLLVDYVGRFETLQGSLDKVLEELGVPGCTLPHINKVDSTKRSYIRSIWQALVRATRLKNRAVKHIRYAQYYNEETISVVSDLYKDDIENFHYQFDRN